MSVEPNATTAFEAFTQYDFDNDDRFKTGMAAILNRADENPATRVETRERAKWFYYNKFIEPFDFEQYLAWKGAATNKSEGEEKKDESKEVAADDPDKPKRFTFQELVEMIETGQEIPGIRQIPNKLNEGAPSQPKLSARRKPWETKTEE